MKKSAARDRSLVTLIFGDSGATPAGATQYLGCFSAIYGTTDAQTAETTWTVRYMITRKGTIKNMAVFSGNAAGAGESFVFTARKNGSDQSLTVTISGATERTDKDITNSFTVDPGDYLTVKIVTSAGANAIQHLCFLEFES